MEYTYKLILRLLTAIILLSIPFNVFYWLLLKPTLYLSYLPLLLKYNNIQIGYDYLMVNSNLLRFTMACIATSAYYLFVIFLLLTKDIKLRNLLKIAFSGILLILLLNIIRIDILIFIFLEYGVNWFNSLHLFFWKFLSSIAIVLVWIFLCYKFKIKNIPVYSDFKFLIKKIKN